MNGTAGASGTAGADAGGVTGNPDAAAGAGGAGVSDRGPTDTMNMDAAADGVPCVCNDDGNPCTTESCATGVCVHANVADDNACAGGTCHAGSCRTTCWDGRACQPGTTVAACGKAGGNPDDSDYAVCY